MNVCTYTWSTWCTCILPLQLYRDITFVLFFKLINVEILLLFLTRFICYKRNAVSASVVSFSDIYKVFSLIIQLYLLQKLSHLNWQFSTFSVKLFQNQLYFQIHYLVFSRFKVKSKKTFCYFGKTWNPYIFKYFKSILELFFVGFPAMLELEESKRRTQSQNK